MILGVTGREMLYGAKCQVFTFSDGGYLHLCLLKVCIDDKEVLGFQV